MRDARIQATCRSARACMPRPGRTSRARTAEASALRVAEAAARGDGPVDVHAPLELAGSPRAEEVPCGADDVAEGRRARVDWHRLTREHDRLTVLADLRDLVLDRAHP